MAEKPRHYGLKLSMLTQPVGRPASRASPAAASRSPAGYKTYAGVPGAPRSFAGTRLMADLIDLAVSLPIAGILLVGLPFAIGWTDRDTHGGAYAAVGMFFLMIPYCIPLAAFLYAVATYGLFRNTLGKRKMGIVVRRSSGQEASRKRLLLRPLANWGLLFVIAILLIIVAALIVIFEDDGPSSTVTSVLPFILIFVAVPSSMIVYQVLNRVLVSRRGASLTDRISRTRVVRELDSGVDKQVE